MPPRGLLGDRAGVLDDGGGGGGNAGQGARKAGRTGTTMTLTKTVGQGLRRCNECIAFPVVVVFLGGELHEGRSEVGVSEMGGHAEGSGGGGDVV